MMQTTLTF